MEVLKGWKQGEVIKSTTECYSVGYTTAMYVMMNMKTWNKLPKDIQKIIEEVNAEWLVKHAAGWDKADQAGREFSLSLGNKIIPLSTPVFDNYVKTAKGKGLPGDAYLDFIRKGIKKYSK
jgi:TRAP-type C4-dicarboxylate transport system substrate-binding protein